MSFWPKFYLKMIIPLLLMATIILFPVIENKVIPFLQRRSINSANSLSNNRILSFLMFYFVTLYTFIVSSVISPFKCSLQSDSTYFLSDNPSEPCYAGDWNKNFPIVITFIILYVVVVPFFLIFVFFIFGRARGKDSLWFTSRFGLLVRPYQRKLYYWELVGLLRRAIFATATSFWKSGDDSYTTRLLTTIIFMFAFLWLDVFISPYVQGTKFVAAT
jgi:hypothetical protein